MVTGPSPLLRPESTNWHDIVTDGAIHVIAEHGLSGLSVRALADWLGVTPSAVSQRSARGRLVAVVAQRFCDRWMQWIHERTYEHGLLALLPSGDEELLGLRVWFALVELARDDEATAERVLEVQAAERRLLAELVAEQTQVECPDDLVDRLFALVEGLRLAVTAPRGPMPIGRARALLSGDSALPQLPPSA